VIRNFVLCLLFCVSLVLSSCAAQEGLEYSRTGGHAWTGGLVTTSYIMADNLQNNLSQPISPNDTIIVASFVNVDNLQESSTLGRIIAEQIGSRFAQKGYKVVEMKLRQHSVFMAERKGEFLLSRDLREVSRNHNAAAVVVGVYGEGFDQVYVSSRIVRPSDNVVIASCDTSIPMGVNEMEVMLHNY